jgi:hypothetical protein
LIKVVLSRSISRPPGITPPTWLTVNWEWNITRILHYWFFWLGRTYACKRVRTKCNRRIKRHPSVGAGTLTSPKLIIFFGQLKSFLHCWRFIDYICDWYYKYIRRTNSVHSATACFATLYSTGGEHKCWIVEILFFTSDFEGRWHRSSWIWIHIFVIGYFDCA